MKRNIRQIEAQMWKNRYEAGKQLGMSYRPASDAISLQVYTPDSMSEELHNAIDFLLEQVGNLDDYVGKKLNYKTLNELYSAFSAEQIDGIALGIYNIEVKKQAVIIADQTGIGKGRIAAGIIRYARIKGKQAIFITEKPNLFSDIYRDLFDIGSSKLVPFIVNAKDKDTDIKDEDGKLIYKTPPAEVQKKIIESGKLPKEYDLCMLTYSQLNIGEYDKKGVFKGTPKKLAFLRKLAENNILIMDESHNAAGDSNTGGNLKSLASICEGIIFLSATFAKRADNMPIYSMKTCMGEAELTPDQIEDAMKKGGVALQEIISSDLVSQGQLVRRERTFDGVEINYLVTENLGEGQRKKSDSITEIIRLIIKFQDEHVKPEIEAMDKIVSANNAKAETRKGTKGAGVDQQPFVSKIFNTINQLLFAIKIDAIVDRALMRLKQGKKPVIAFSSTMGAFVQDLLDTGTKYGEVVSADFSMVLRKALDGVLRYTIKDDSGEPEYKTFALSDFSDDAQLEYRFIASKIASAVTDLVISPIDLIIQRLEAEGYKVGEVTGRNNKMFLKKNGTKWVGTIDKRTAESKTDTFRDFNNNEIDVLLINQSGSTGVSAHAIPTAKVPAKDVKQRVMIIGQAELDINREVQKRGRIMRTGQIMLPIYDYLISAIPAEKRLAMMLKKKLKSLDANTTSNQKTSERILRSEDFLNKYGDRIVVEYLAENRELSKALGEPFNFEADSQGNIDQDKLTYPENAASKTAGRVAILSTKDQEEFYEEVNRRYDNYVNQLIENDDYDLEVEVMNLEAKSLSKNVQIQNPTKNGVSAFSDHCYIQECEVNVLKKPFPSQDVERKIINMLDGKTPNEYAAQMIAEMSAVQSNRLNEQNAEAQEKREKSSKGMKGLKGYKQALTPEQKELFLTNQRIVIEEAYELALEKNKRKLSIEFDRLSEIFNFFKPGKIAKLPNDVENARGGITVGIVEGYTFGNNKKNKFHPSNVSLKILLSSSKKSISFDITDRNLTEIYAIKGKSDYQYYPLADALELYREAIKKSSVNRNNRFIITGNLLLFFGSAFTPKGRLIQYTTDNGQILKGALLPEIYGENLKTYGNTAKVTVLLSKALVVLNNMSRYNNLPCTDKVSIANGGWGTYTIYAPRKKDLGGKVYLNKELLAITNNGEFRSSGTTMVGYISTENIQEALEILTKIGIRGELTQQEMQLIKQEMTEKVFVTQKSNIRANKPKPTLPKGDNVAAQAQAQRIRILKLKLKIKA